MSRPEGVEAQWYAPKGTPHGAPILNNGRLIAATRDASWYDRPDVRKVKRVHVVVHSAQLGPAAACQPNRIVADQGTVWAAADAPVRCTARACALLFARADQEAAQR